MWRIKAPVAPTAAAVCLPAFFVPRGLSRLASAADSAAHRAVAPVALLVVEQVVHSMAGRAAVERVAVREPFPPAEPPAVGESFPPAAERLAVRESFLPAAVPLAAGESFPPAAERLAVRESFLPAAVRLAARESFPPAAEPPAVRESCRPAAVPKKAARCELVEAYRLAHSPPARWRACSLARSTAARWPAA